MESAAGVVAAQVAGMPWRDEVCLRAMKELEIALGGCGEGGLGAQLRGSAAAYMKQTATPVG